MLHATIRGRQPRRVDRGSAMPMIIGMLGCVLLLGAGVIAATSAFAARSALQHACDGAAAAAAHALPASPDDDGAAALNAAWDYLANRGDIAITNTQTVHESIALECSTDSPILFGAAFGSPTRHFTVSALSHATLGTVAQ